MSCCGEREKGPPERKQRWEFIQLNDFRATSFLTYLAYGWLWFMAVVSIIVYALDTFTAVNLLIFDRWSSQVQPAIPFRYSKWIFAGCIICSFSLLIYEWVRALRVVKRDGVAASYMDPIAMSVQSMRSRGWKRFLVYTELTKSKKGTDYVAFFVYFAFQGAVRVILAEGPRQVINALTLYAVMQAKLIDGGKTTDGRSQFSQFFQNLETLADQNVEQAMIFSSMFFSLVIWVFSALCLLAAGILYLVFLWHYIPQKDGRLRIYCRRKIDRRLEKIVEHWVKEAMEQEARQREADERKREKAEKKAELKRQKTGELPPPPGPGITRAPTLPDIGEFGGSKKEDVLSLNRQDTKSTVATLPLYSSRPSTAHDMNRNPSLPDLGEGRPPVPSRSATQGSAWSKASFESDAPLMPNAALIGADGHVPSPAPTYYSRQPSNTSFAPAPPYMPGRVNTQSTQRSFTPTSANGARPPPGSSFPVRSNTAYSFDEPQSAMADVSPIHGKSQTPVGPPMPLSTADGWQPGPRRKDSDVSYFSRPVAAPTPPPMNQTGRRPTLDNVSAIPPMPMGRRPTLESTNRPQQPPMTRQATVDSVNPPYRGPTPTARLPTRQSSFSRPFTPALSINTNAAPNSYGVRSQAPLPPVPSAPAATNVYKPFSPAVHQHQNSSGTIVQDGPRRNVTVAGTQAPMREGHDDYFTLAPPRSFTDPARNSALSSYGSILDEYGAYTPGEQPGAAPGPPQQQQGQFRAYTPGPAPGNGRW